MEANIRILQSIKKLNESIAKTEEQIKQASNEIIKVKDEINNTQNTFDENTQNIKNIQSTFENKQNEFNINQNELKIKQEELEKELNNTQELIKKQKQSVEKKTDEIINKIDNIKFRVPKDGKDGKDGRDGKDGKDGERGLMGLPGIAGKDGVSITNTKVDDKGDLIIKLSNGKNINAGHVKGANGSGYNGRDGSDGVSVDNAEVRNGHLYIKLSNGKEIDAGVVSGGTSEETDPIFTASVAHEITSQDITNWNNKSDFKNNYYSVILNANGTVDTYSQDINYQTIKSNLSNSKIKDILEITWVTTTFLIEATEETSGDIKFIGDIEFDGIQRRMVFTLTPNNVLTTTLITTNEIVSNKRTSIINNLSNEFYPTTNAVYNEFDRKPVLIYDKVNKLHIPGTITAGTDGDNGLLNQNQGEGTNRNITSWNITGMDLSTFKYIRVVFSRNDITSAVTGEFCIPLDGDYITNGDMNAYVSGISMPYYAVRTRLVGIGCAVSSDKTSFTVTQTISLTATTLGMVATTVNDMFVTKIEGYYD